jgi:hypothetical protein
MISGKWGCGKTYYIERQIEEWSKTKVKASADTIELKPVYISVNGITTISSFVRQIKIKLYPILYSKGMAVAKKVAFSALQILTKSKVDIDNDGTGEDLKTLLDAEGILEVFKSESSAIKGNRILILDDLERCRIPLDELFGFINGIVEHSNSKVILLCDEEKLSKVAEQEELKVKYEDFKEKLVGQTFSLDVDYAAVTSLFIDEAKNAVLTANKDFIIELFMASKSENLRLARRCMMDVVRLFEQLSIDTSKYPNFEVFAKNVVAYLTIASIEARSGNSLIDKYQGYNFSEEDKQANQALEEKYVSLLERHHIYHSAYSIPIKQLVNFIRTGYIDSPKQFVESSRILHSRNMADWEKLWWCDKLTNEEFLEILKKEKTRFYNKELDYAYEVVHLAGILLSLEKRELIKLSRRHVVSIAKKSIAELYQKYPNDFQRTQLSDRGYEFQESRTEEMKEIISYAGTLFQKRADVIEKEYVRRVWNNIGPDTTRESLNKQFEELTPNRQYTYAMKCIFTQVSPRDLAARIVALPNAAKIEFSHFLMGRYYLEGCGVIAQIDDEKKADKSQLVKISTILKSKAKHLKLLDKEKTNLIIRKIDEAVAKM